MYKSFCYALIVSFVATPTSFAQAPETKKQPVATARVVKLSLTPAAEAKPALRYQLLPTAEKRLPGNGAPFYYRSIMQMLSLSKTPAGEHYKKCVEQWKQSVHDIPVEDLRKCVKEYQTVFDQLHIATHREYCDWGWRTQDLKGTAIFEFLLPELQELRNMARLLVMKATLQIQDGQEKEALETLQIGFQTAHDSSQQPFLINALMAVAISEMLKDSVIDVIDHADSPNLYWAMAALPKPIVDIRPAMSNELNSFERVFSLLKNPEQAKHTTEEWQQLSLRQFLSLHIIAEQPGPLAIPEDKTLTPEDPPFNHDEFRQQFPIAVANAKKELVAQGVPVEQVEKMADGQALAIQSSRALRYASDEMLKYYLLDGPELITQVNEVEQRLEREGYLSPPLQGKEPFGIATMLYPALSKVAGSSRKLQRNLAAIQVIEALRMHAAQNEGRLPASLAEIKVVPVPANPITNQPFPYILTEKQARLEVPQVRSISDAVRYEIEIETAK